MEARFFLHLIPADMNDLPDHRQLYGFDNLDFDFDERRVLHEDGRCMATTVLPKYDIVRIRTGQFLPGEGRVVWQEEFPFSGVPDNIISGGQSENTQ